MGPGIVGDDGAHAATGGGEGHLHVHLVAPFEAFAGFERINQSEIDNVDRDLGVENFFQCLPQDFGIDGAVGAGGMVGLRFFGDFLAEGVGIGPADAEHAVAGHDGEVAAEAVGDGHRFALGQGHGRALRDEGDFNFAGECAGFVHYCNC